MNLVKDKEITGTTMSDTKSNVHSAGVQGQEKYPTEKSIVILGDSMVKHINEWDLAKKTKGNCQFKVYVKLFFGATRDCMIDYSKPSVRHEPNYFILHVGINDLKSEESPEFIIESMIDLAVSLKNEKQDVSISNIL